MYIIVMVDFIVIFSVINNVDKRIKRIDKEG